MYLEKFVLPIDIEEKLVYRRACENGGKNPYIDNVYPCGIFTRNGFREIDFERITIFYGGNGSGKSTLLNLIATKLQLNRIAPFNNSELFSDYVNKCKFFLGFDEEGFPYRIPNGSRIITSDDIFDYMLTVRTNNDEIGENIEIAKGDWVEQKYGDTVKMRGLEDYEAVRLQVLARQKSLSRRKFIRRVVGTEVKLNSNGETALEYFNSKLRNDTLYCLDEPENSLSPKLQQQLVEIIRTKARYCGCQFVIATHSPFVLALDNAKIYDLDSNPVDVKKWSELENSKAYYDFFLSHKDLFEESSKPLERISRPSKATSKKETQENLRTKK